MRGISTIGAGKGRNNGGGRYFTAAQSGKNACNITNGARVKKPYTNSNDTTRAKRVSGVRQKIQGSPAIEMMQELNAHVRKGEHGSLVVCANRFTKVETNARGEDVEKEIPFLKGYTVFNTEQIDNLPAHYYVKLEPVREPLKLIDAAEAFFTATGAVIRHGGNRAYYACGADTIHLPPPEAFKDAESYEATKAHEVIHWTKHESRLNRDFGRKKFGDEGYAREKAMPNIWQAG